MKLLAIAIVCLSVVLAEEKSDSSSKIDQLDVVELAKESGDTKSSDAQRKRDSGYSYTRPDRFSSSQRWELSGVRGRIVTKPSTGQTARPFTRYGPPKQSGPHLGKPSGQYAPHHQYSAPHNRRPQQTTGGQMHQEVPSPVRTYDFVEASPIASQNNEPFNSNAAGYLPPRNQKLPGYSTSQTFSNQQTTRRPENHQQQHQQQQNGFNNNFQSQQLVQGHFQDHQQISDAAHFLAENAQAISQLYEAPAVDLNYEPIQNFQGSQDQQQNPNSQFQTFEISGPSQGGQNQGSSDDLRGFQGRLPSYASGVLDPQQALQQIQSIEKDRLISQLQQDLVTAQGKVEGSASARYAQNHPTGSYVQNQALLASFGQINPSIGPQLDRPNSFNGQKPFAGGASAFGGTHFLPTSTTSSGFIYGLQSTTPATQSPSTPTTISSTATSSTAQRPVQGDGSSQVGTAVSPPGTAPTYPFLQYGGFVPTLIGNNLLASYPQYGTNFIGTAPSSVTPAQPAGSSPTHFGLPIPNQPAGGQGTAASSPPARPPLSQKPQVNPGQHHQQPSTPVNLFPLQPVQPIHPIAATPVHPVYSIAPSVTQLHPGQASVPVASGQPTYGLQPAVVNPLLIKPVKAVYPVYYYPNVYQIQKPALPTYPWNYAPSYAQTKPGQAWK